jgi:hypothetical protein
MKYPAEQENFLKNIKKFSKNYVSIIVDGKLQSFCYEFWTWTKIKEALSMCEEWEVDFALTPFYGNWHDLYCLNANTGEIVSIDDDREVNFTWSNIDVFMQSFSTEEVVYDLSEVEATVTYKSPDFDEKFKKYLIKK